MRRTTALAVLLVLAACQTPPPSAYVRGSIGGDEKPVALTSLGANAAGETCTLEEAAVPGGKGADIYCGTWKEPSASVASAPGATPADLAATAAAGPWRAGIDARMACEAPVSTTILGGQPALVLQCARRVGGWPQVAMVALVGGTLWRGDAVLPAATVMERAIGVLAGIAKPGDAAPASAADGILASRLAARAFRSGDVGLYDQLMVAGTRANLASDPTDAEVAFRAALALQQKALGPNDPNTVATLLPLAVQLSNQARYTEARAVFAQAATLTPRSSDETAPARLLHYRALDAKNQGRLADAMALMLQAEAAYTALVPSDALHAQVQARVVATHYSAPGEAAAPSLTPTAEMVADPRGQLALTGLIEVRRNRALLLRSTGHSDEADDLVQSAIDLAQANGIARPLLTGRLYRTIGVTAASTGADDTAIGDLRNSAGRFRQALPGSKTLAETELLRADELQRAGRGSDAIDLCQTAIASLISLKAGTAPRLIEPCLDAYAADAPAAGAERQQRLADMFVAAQVAKGTITAEQIAQATARLRENARDARVSQAIRAWQDSTDALADLYRQRDELLAAASEGRTPSPGATPADLDKRIAAAQAAQAEADAALQVASPNFGQLVEQIVPASAVLAALRPNEAFVSISLGEHSGWVFVLRRGAAGIDRITVARAGGGLAHMAELVHRLRESIEPTEAGIPKFDIAASQNLYAATLAPVAPALVGATALVVAPAGPLLSVPFGVLLTGPATDLASAPWLIRQAAIAHVPSPANFLSLRKAGASAGDGPWFGFGGFRPVTLAQAEATFPSAACADSAKLFAGAPPLTSALRELTAARQLLGAPPSDEMLDAAFTADAVLKANLKPYRVLHFATHALLPAELQCENEPAIITSAPPGARDANGALLTASKIVGMDLDADLIILSACNSGGPGGATAGESLSGLARAFFFAGTRSMLATHWSVSDQAAAYLVADTLRRMHASPSKGVAQAMREAELGMLAAAGHGLPADLAHPFFWAPFAVIGEGNTQGAAAPTATASPSIGAPTGL
jgi:CHAT domain-containing protein